MEKIEEINADPNNKSAWRFINNTKGNKKLNNNSWISENNQKLLDWMKTQTEANNSTITPNPSSFYQVPDNQTISFKVEDFVDIF